MIVPSRHAVAASLIVLVVGAAVLAGLVVVGSPAQARLEQLDARRVEHLQRWSRLIDVHWTKHGRLPLSLDEVAREPRGTSARDPITGVPYEYRPTGDRRYELCAVFDRRTNAASREQGDAFWEHEAGRTCFPLEVRVAGRS